MQHDVPGFGVTTALISFNTVIPRFRDKYLFSMTAEAKCPTVYGPKKSRRQGLSLGLNLGAVDVKCCTWSCVYCQCGFGKKAESLGQYVPRDQILKDLNLALDEHRHLDSVTMAGNSEPTTYFEFLQLTKDILALREKRNERWIFNCLSNGSELDKPEIRTACELLDETWVKLDCGVDSLFKRLNGPMSRLGTVSDQVRRIQTLSKPRLQTLLWKDSSGRGLGNDTSENMTALLSHYQVIRPLRIDLTTVQRETAAEGLIPASPAELECFAARVRELNLNIAVFP